jgi:hypothetical protein
VRVLRPSFGRKRLFFSLFSGAKVMVRLNVDAAKMMLVVLGQRGELGWRRWQKLSVARGCKAWSFRVTTGALSELGFVEKVGRGRFRLSSSGSLFLKALGCRES